MAEKREISEFSRSQDAFGTHVIFKHAAQKAFHFPEGEIGIWNIAGVRDSGNGTIRFEPCPSGAIILCVAQ